jgi:polyhydroxyalkanoate synthesis regulator phasin
MYEIIPEVVSVPENEESGLWGLDYDKLVPVLVKAIQEQQEVIDKQQKFAREQQNEIDKLKQKNSEIDALRAEIEQLKQQMVR